MFRQTITNNSVKEILLPSGRILTFDKPLVMGILNVTPDSFSDGGRTLTPDSALIAAANMITHGVDIIDIGGESSRPGAVVIELAEEIKRVIPVIKAIRKISDIPISIDTCKTETARLAYDAGADMVNDISALRFSDTMVHFIAEKKIPVILMHMLGTPQTMQKNPVYQNVNAEIIEYFKTQIIYAEANGIDRDKIIIDPGIGFGKRLKDNLEILSNLDQYKSLGQPILIGTSRKSFIEKLHPTGKPPENRIGGSIASMLAAIQNGADIVRVHDTEETIEAINILKAIRGNR